MTHRKQITENTKKQEAHGPRRSPEKPVQINTHILAKIWLYHILRGKNHYLLLENRILYICKTLSPLQPMTFCAKFGWNWHSASGEKDYSNFLKVFTLFLIYLFFEKGVTLHMNKLESPSPKDALCQIWFKLVLWFWRSIWKCEKFTDRRTDWWRTTGNQKKLKAQVS